MYETVDTCTYNTLYDVHVYMYSTCIKMSVFLLLLLIIVFQVIADLGHFYFESVSDWSVDSTCTTGMPLQESVYQLDEDTFLDIDDDGKCSVAISLVPIVLLWVYYSRGICDSAFFPSI